MIGLIGDIHGNFEALNAHMRNHPEIKAWIQVGDLGGEKIAYEDLVSPCYFISGNHENWDAIESIAQNKGPKNLIHIRNGSLVNIQGLNAIGFGGNYSQKFFEYKQKDLPQGRRRHFVQEQFELALDNKLQTNVDLLITHEAPSPFIKNWRGSEMDVGNAYIAALVTATEPKFHFFGHHHFRSNRQIGATQSIGLCYGEHGFYTLCPKTLDIIHIDKDCRIDRDL